MRPDSIGEFVISGHARLEMQRRDVTDNMVQQVVASAEQRFRVCEGRVERRQRCILYAWS